MVRYLSAELSIEQILFFRNFLGLIALLPLILRSGVSNLKTNNIMGHVLRGLIGVTAMYCYFWTLAHIPLTEAFLVKLSVFLFMPIFAYLWLKEFAHRLNFVSFFIGFGGVVVILSLTLGAIPEVDGPVFAIWIGLWGAVLWPLS